MSLGCDGGESPLVSAITWHVLRLEKRAVWLVSLLLLNLTVMFKMPMHGWHVKSRVGLGRVETSVKISFSLPSSCLA